MIARLNFKSMVFSAALLGTASLAAGQAKADCGGNCQAYRSGYSAAPQVYRSRSGYQSGPAYPSTRVYGSNTSGLRSYASPGAGNGFESYRRSMGKP